MAKRARKTTKKRETAKKFFALRSECGGVEQLHIITNEYGGDSVYPNARLARSAVADHIDVNGNDGCMYVVVEIIDVAKSAGVAWTGKSAI